MLHSIYGLLLHFECSVGQGILVILKQIALPTLLLLLYLERVPDLKLVEPALARNEVLALAQFFGFFFDHFGSDESALFSLQIIPLEE